MERKKAFGDVVDSVVFGALSLSLSPYLPKGMSGGSASRQNSTRMDNIQSVHGEFTQRTRAHVQRKGSVGTPIDSRAFTYTDTVDS